MSTQQQIRQPAASRPWRRLWAIALLTLLAALVALGVKGWLVAQRARALYDDAPALTSTLDKGLDAVAVAELGPLLADLRADAAALRAEAGPLLPLGRLLGWVPSYGPALAALEPLLDVAVELSVAADEGYGALAPLLAQPDQPQPLGPRVVSQLSAAEPRLARARAAAGRALELWPQLPIDAFPESLRAPLARIESLLPEARDGLDLLLVAPELLGGAGPRPYLLYAQNPDELRPTGGFISVAGTFTLSGGLFADVALADTGQFDDPGQFIYPDPPAALQRYIGFELWLLRDSNWSPDFPTAARTGMELYRSMYTQDVGGVVALNPRALELILAAIGPLAVDGATVSADNVVAYIHQGYHGGEIDPGNPWVVRRKSFLGPLSAAIIGRLQQPAGIALPELARALEQGLRERHLQIFLREPAAERVLARRGWDGGLRIGDQDFLMVADANLGYNKVNPRIQQAITYTVDLGDPGAPLAELRVNYRHTLPESAACDQTRGYEVALEIARYEDWISGCYWNYSRVLSPRGTELLSGTAHATPGEWMISGQAQAGAPAMLGEEAGANVIEQFFVVPSGSERETALRYRLPPATVATTDDGRWTYRLMVQKQSGSRDSPVTVRVRLPPGRALESASPRAELDPATGVVTFTFRLNHDQQVALTFR